jgi:nucleoside-diphosphate-sugar epimerase
MDANRRIVLAGATGNLGGRIARALSARGAEVVALVRPGTLRETLAPVQALGARAVETDFGSVDELERACSGAACLVSALSGLRETVIGTQTALLDAAVRAGVPRFTVLPPGSNRNLDLRREFGTRLDTAPIQATSIFNGAFADMLTGQAPLILFKFRRVVFIGSPDVPMDFTTMDDVAAFTAAAALDPSAPRHLHVAGSRVTAREIADIAGKVRGERFRLMRAGSLGTLRGLIKVARWIAPQPDALYPPWQGMQYMHNMFSGAAADVPLDNGRYPDIRFTGVETVIASA